MPQTIKTERLVLRQPMATDAAAVALIVNDEEVTRWLSQVPYPYTLADAQDFIARQTSSQTFLICLDDSVVGCIGTVGEFGYWLGRAHWGQGIMTEASQAVLAWHFDTEGTTLRSGHAVGNTRSRNVLLKMGFEDVAVVPRTHKITGAVRDQQVMELTPQAWRKAA